MYDASDRYKIGNSTCPDDLSGLLGQHVSVRDLELLELELTPQQPPACPSWCDKEAGHEYDSSEYDTGRFANMNDALIAGELIICRYHRRRVRDLERETVEVQQLEAATCKRGAAPTVELDSASVWADIGFQDDLPVQDARELAEALLAAVTLVDGLNRP